MIARAFAGFPACQGGTRPGVRRTLFDRVTARPPAVEFFGTQLTLPQKGGSVQWHQCSVMWTCACTTGSEGKRPTVSPVRVRARRAFSWRI